MASAAELFQHHAFVDLETTGLDPASDRVIEVGVLFVHEGRPVERISRLFCSVVPLPLSIRRLTGIDDAALIGRPPFEAFLPELRTALSGWTVVAHNASFERGFLADLLQEIDAAVLDSCELLHYLYPELESYSLESMIRWTGIGDRAAHRALKDCEDTFAMLCRCLDRCIEDRRGEDVAELLECLAPSGPPNEEAAATLEPVVSFLAKLAGFCRNQALPSTNHSDHLAPPSMPGLSPHNQPREVGGPSSPILPQHEAQAWIAEALERETVSAIELEPVSAHAGTSLDAAAAFARRNGCRVSLVIGSDSRLRSLLRSGQASAQRTHRELVRYFFLDEQQRYLCRRRAMDVCRTEATMRHEERAPRAYLRAYLRRSTTGDIGGLSHWFKVRYPLLQRLALAGRSESATTLGARCPHYAACFYHSALSRSKEADVLLVRHTTFAAWPPDYPSSRHAVIDDAHQLEGAFSSALAREVSNDALDKLHERLLGVGGRGGLLRSLEAWVPVGAAPEATRLMIRDGTAKSELIRRDAECLGEALAKLLPSSEETPHRKELPLTAQLRASDRWAPIGALLLELKTHLAELGSCLSGFREALRSGAPTRLDLERDLFGATSEALLLDRCAAEFVPSVEGEPETRCLSAFLDERSKAWKLRSEPLHVAEAFARAAAEQSVVLSSAALSIGGRNSWILGRLGVSSTVHQVAAAAHRRPLLLLIEDSPKPFEEEFFDWAAARIRGIATFLGGRTMGVFSSQSRLARMEDRVRPALEAVGIEAIRVSRARPDGRGVSTTAGRVLLGARSVWHQTELPRGLAFVFIDKLPVDPLSRPSVAAREALASLECKDERYRSMPYRLPSALVQLRHWLSTCCASSEQNLVIVLASAGASHQRDAVAEALEGYRPALVPWSAARLRIYEALRPIAERRPETRLMPGAAGSSSDDASARRIAEAAFATHRLRFHTDGS
ncbi:MAG TPA: exonuclease domain-containing protein [Myxococcaceae bacterium]|nr:exonuclease domain-containing protein [Myxococcaceae bacterium]